MLGGMWRQNTDLPEVMAKMCSFVVREDEGGTKSPEREVWVL